MELCPNNSSASAVSSDKYSDLVSFFCETLTRPDLQTHQRDIDLGLSSQNCALLTRTGALLKITTPSFNPHVHKDVMQNVSVLIIIFMAVAGHL